MVVRAEGKYVKYKNTDWRLTQDETGRVIKGTSTVFTSIA